jgi:hypothetical protein
MVNIYRNFYQPSIKNSPNEWTQEGKSAAVSIRRENHQRINQFHLHFLREAAELSHSTITVRAEDFLLYYLARRF